MTKPAIARAVGALIARQREDGAWRDFFLPGGASDEWVTAYAGAALALIPNERARGAAVRAWEFLAAQSSARAGWGYSSNTPQDADSTSWALILAQRLNKRRESPARRGVEFLRSALSASGAATYERSDAIRAFTGIDSTVSFAGWTQPHWCVSGAVALCSNSCSALCDAIAAAQQTDGSWHSYWWNEDLYATATCSLALRRHRRANGSLIRAGTWSKKAMCTVDGAFATALGAIVAGAAGDIDSARRWTRRLVATQQAGGLWESGAWLRVPAPDVTDPASITRYETWSGRLPRGRTVAMCNFASRDVRHIFTTATALTALAMTG